MYSSGKIEFLETILWFIYSNILRGLYRNCYHHIFHSQVNGLYIGKASVEIAARDDIRKGGIVTLVPLSNRPGTRKRHEVPLIPNKNKSREDCSSSSSRSSTPVPSQCPDLPLPMLPSSETSKVDGAALSGSHRKSEKASNALKSVEPSSSSCLSPSASSNNNTTSPQTLSNSLQVLNSTQVKPQHSSNASKTPQKSNPEAQEGSCLSQVLGSLHRLSSPATNDIQITPDSPSNLIQNDLAISSDDDGIDPSLATPKKEHDDNEVEIVGVKDVPIPSSRGNRARVGGVGLRSSGRVVKPVNYSEKKADYMQMILAPLTFALQLENGDSPSSLVECSLCNKTMPRNCFVYHIEVKHCHLVKRKESGKATKGPGKIKCEISLVIIVF